MFEEIPFEADGGFLLPKSTASVNETGHPEPVLTAEQRRALEGGS